MLQSDVHDTSALLLNILEGSLDTRDELVDYVSVIDAGCLLFGCRYKTGGASRYRGCAIHRKLASSLWDSTTKCKTCREEIQQNSGVRGTERSDTCNGKRSVS